MQHIVTQLKIRTYNRFVNMGRHISNKITSCTESTFADGPASETMVGSRMMFCVKSGSTVSISLQGNSVHSTLLMWLEIAVSHNVDHVAGSLPIVMSE